MENFFYTDYCQRRNCGTSSGSLYCSIHNYLTSSGNSDYCTSGYCDYENTSGEVVAGQWRRGSNSTSNDISALRGRRPRDDALYMRDCLKEYLNSEAGLLPWQLDYVRRTN